MKHTISRLLLSDHKHFSAGLTAVRTYIKERIRSTSYFSNSVLLGKCELNSLNKINNERETVELNTKSYYVT